MNILITGGAGYIGSHISLVLLDKGHEVTIVDSLITGSEKLIPKKSKFFKCDISNEKKITQIIKQTKFDVVIHLAGLIKVAESVQFPEKYNLFNYTKTKKFINICIKNKLNKFIFSSTAAVYGNSKTNCHELSKLKPTNPYAKSKLKVENFLKSMMIKKKLKFVILRYFNVAGADLKLRSGLIDKNPSHLIKVACEVAVKKRKFLIVNGSNFNTRDKTAIRDYIHVLDLANIHILAASYILKKKKSQILNCGYGVGFSVLEVINTFNSIIESNIKFQFGPKRKGDVEKVVANCNKVKTVLNWKPKFNKLRAILESAYNWEKKLTSRIAK